MKSKICIYGLFHPITDELRYVGQTIQGIKRYNGHIRDAKNGKHNHLPLYRWITKLHKIGLKPTFKILQYCLIEELDSYEVHYISKFKTNIPKLLNISPGGSVLRGKDNHFYGKKHSDKTRQIISAKNTGKKRVIDEPTRKRLADKRKELSTGVVFSSERKARISAKAKGRISPFKGKHHSEESKLLLSKANTGKSRSDETKQKMSDSSKSKIAIRDLTTGKEYNKIMVVCEELNLFHSNVYMNVIGKINHVKGHDFVAINNTDLVILKYTNKIAKEKKKLDKQRPFIDQNGGIFYNTIAASKALNINTGSIWNVLRGKAKTAKGYTFKYLKKDLTLLT